MPRSVVNASGRRSGPLPQMDGPLGGWMNFMSFKMVTKAMVNYEITQTETDYPFEGVFEPMPSRDLYLKAEGQRNWKWWTLWVRNDMDIDNGDIIEDFNGKRFKVMKSQDWGQANYQQFDLLEDYVERGA